MTSNKLRKLITLLKEQGVEYYKGCWAGEEIEINLASKQTDSKTDVEQMDQRMEEAEHLFFSKETTQPKQPTREELIKQFDADLF